MRNTSRLATSATSTPPSGERLHTSGVGVETITPMYPGEPAPHESIWPVFMTRFWPGPADDREPRAEWFGEGERVTAGALRVG